MSKACEIDLYAHDQGFRVLAVGSSQNAMSLQVWKRDKFFRMTKAMVSFLTNCDGTESTWGR